MVKLGESLIGLWWHGGRRRDLAEYWRLTLGTWRRGDERESDLRKEWPSGSSRSSLERGVMRILESDVGWIVETEK